MTKSNWIAAVAYIAFAAFLYFTYAAPTVIPSNF
jgi:hypothetical protein